MELWSRLSQCETSTLEYRVSQLVRQIGLSGIGELCGVEPQEVREWFEVRSVPPSFDAILRERVEGLDFLNPASLVEDYQDMKAQGLSNVEIADHLGVTRQAVSKGLKARAARSSDGD